MFTDLLLALTIVTGTASVPSQAATGADAQIASPAPSCIAGPVRMRHRKPDGTAQVASTALSQEIAHRGGDLSAQAE